MIRVSWQEWLAPTASDLLSFLGYLESVILRIVGLVLPIVLSGCASSALPAQSPSVSPPVAVPSVEAGQASPTALPSRLTERDDVDWDSGRGTVAHPEPDPSPSGWYEAAFGGPGKSQGKTIFLTFDDGPGSSTSAVLELLEEHQAQATFFVLGRRALASPDLVSAIHSDGHAIGNHSWDHQDLTEMSRKQVSSELTRTNEVVGSPMGPCMRPPYGEINREVGRTAVSLGMAPIMWTDQAWDWRPPATRQIISEMKAGTKPGAVLLLHDGGGDRSRTVEALRMLLPFWERQGYTLRSIPACVPG